MQKKRFSFGPDTSPSINLSINEHKFEHLSTVGINELLYPYVVTPDLFLINIHSL